MKITLKPFKNTSCEELFKRLDYFQGINCQDENAESNDPDCLLQQQIIETWESKPFQIGDILCTLGPEVFPTEERELYKASEAYIIISGIVEATRHNRLVAYFGPGSVVGDNSLISEKPHIYTARARTPCRTIRLGKEYKDLARMTPELLVNVISLTHDWTVGLYQRGEDILHTKQKQPRVIWALLEIAKCLDKNIVSDDAASFQVLHDKVSLSASNDNKGFEISWFEWVRIFSNDKKQIQSSPVGTLAKQLNVDKDTVATTFSYLREKKAISGGQQIEKDDGSLDICPIILRSGCVDILQDELKRFKK